MTWTVRTLGEICDEVGGVIQTGPFGSQLHESDYVEEGVPVVMPKNILDGKIDTSDIAFISDEEAARLQRHKMSIGDIVYGRRGDIGRRGLIGARENGWLCGTGCLRVSLGDRVIDPSYLYYFLGQQAVVGWIANQAVGATMPNLNTGILRSVNVRYPALPLQRRIASILSAYDDLIKNNTRRIKILERMAQMLYREWFVHFRFPGHQKMKMAKSDLGPIPEGWKVNRLGDVAGVNELSIKNSSPPDRIHYIDIASVSTARIEKKESMSFVDAPGRARRIVRHGDTIWSTVRPNRRSYALILNPEPNLIVSTGFAVLTAATVPYSYLYFAATTDEFADYLTNHATGSAYPAVNGKDFENAKLIVPKESVGNRFHEVVAPMLDLTWSLHQRNINLRTTRDLLLPELISGEIPLKAAESAMEQTA